MKFTIHTPTGIEASNDRVVLVNVTLIDGKPLSIHANHAPLMAEISEGARITIKSQDEPKSFSTGGGIILVEENNVKILTQGLHKEEAHA